MRTTVHWLAKSHATICIRAERTSNVLAGPRQLLPIVGQSSPQGTRRADLLPFQPGRLHISRLPLQPCLPQVWQQGAPRHLVPGLWCRAWRIQALGPRGERAPTLGTTERLIDHPPPPPPPHTHTCGRSVLRYVAWMPCLWRL